MVSSYVVFGKESLLGPPVKRAAYSDRMSLMMAEMSKLAYLPFETPPSPDTAQDQDLDSVIQKVKGMADLAQARSILAKYIEEAPVAARRRSGQDLERELKRGGFKLIDTYDVGGTQAFLAVKTPGTDTGPKAEGIAVLSFRGTEQNLKDWKTNLNGMKQMVNGVPIHTGFLQAFRLVKDQIKTDLERLSGQGNAVYITGHSLGGALALIATKEIASSSIGACYTFGSPRVAGFGFAKNIKTPIYRVVNANDLVPRVPPVFLPRVLMFVVSVVPVPYQKWIHKFLEKFEGYVHHGDLRYLTRSKTEKQGNYEDVKLLSNPNIIYRAYWWFRGVLKNPRSPIDDHSKETYCEKLRAYALGRLNISEE